MLCIQLEAQRDLAELIDITDLHELPAGQHKSVAIGHFVADSEGVPAREAADQMINHVLYYGLNAERSRE